jgi:hypothetical protein
MIKSRRMRWAWHVALMGETMILMQKPERKKPLRRPGYRLEDNIKVDLREMGLCGMD